MDYIRQEKIFNPAKHAKPVVVIGCGGIGSFTAVGLAKLGIKDMKLYDDDKIEFHNMPNQLFKMRHEILKVQEVAENCQMFSDDVHMTVAPSKVEGFVVYPVQSVVVSGVDSMASRQAIWKTVKFNPAVDFYIDARIGGQNIRVHTVKPLDKNAVALYEKALYDDKKAEELGCTDRSIIDVGFAVAAVVVRLVRGHLVGEKVPHTVLLSMATMNMTTIGGEDAKV